MYFVILKKKVSFIGVIIYLSIFFYYYFYFGCQISEYLNHLNTQLFISEFIILRASTLLTTHLFIHLNVAYLVLTLLALHRLRHKPSNAPSHQNNALQVTWSTMAHSVF